MKSYCCVTLGKPFPLSNFKCVLEYEVGSLGHSKGFL